MNKENSMKRYLVGKVQHTAIVDTEPAALAIP